ncbi:MAG: hypothetical protein AAGB00_12135 [Planctomycetota bacterium]
MLVSRRVYVVAALAALACSGCAHVKLQRRTNQQVSTITGIYEKQVLDNLAMFCRNPEATPFFSTVTGGAIAVNDTIGASGTSVWNATSFMQGTLSPNASRGFQNNWSATPVSDPTRLSLMRCAYQKAIGRSTYCNGDCPDCCNLAAAWHNPRDLDDTVQTPTITSEDGTVVEPKPCDVKCAPGAGWFCVGGKHDAPKDCCTPVGEHCGTYVWVKPCGREALHRLTMLVLEYASGTAYAPPTEEVVYKWRFDETKQEYVLAHVEVTAQEPAKSLEQREEILDKQAEINAESVAEMGPNKSKGTRDKLKMLRKDRDRLIPEAAPRLKVSPAPAPDARSILTLPPPSALPPPPVVVQ